MGLTDWEGMMGVDKKGRSDQEVDRLGRNDKGEVPSSEKKSLASEQLLTQIYVAAAMGQLRTYVCRSG